MSVDENKLRGLIGLCVRARQATFGMDGCLNAVRSRKAGAAVMDAGASAATQDKFLSACQHHGVPVVTVREGLLQEATGRPGVVMTVAPGGLANQLRSLPELQAQREQTIKPENHCGGASVD